MTGHKEEIGRTLREARQAAGRTLKDIAEEIRIRPIYLQAIESGRFELLPALPQTIGFTRAYAKHLKVDVERPLSRLGKEVHETIGQVDYSEPEIQWTMISSTWPAWIGSGVLFALALAAMLAFDILSRPDEVAIAPIEAEGTSPAAVSAQRAVGAAARTTDNALLPSVQAGGTVPAAETISRTPRVEAPAFVQQPSFVQSPETSRAAERSAAPSVSTPSTDVAVAPENQSVFESSVAAADLAPTAALPADAVPFADPHLATGNVYVRSRPDNSGRIVGVLKVCERVGLLGHDATGYWREVTREDGMRGWVFRDYVRGETLSGCS